jgi:hypothetical protein
VANAPPLLPNCTSYTSAFILHPEAPCTIQSGRTLSRRNAVGLETVQLLASSSGVRALISSAWMPLLGEGRDKGRGGRGQGGMALRVHPSNSPRLMASTTLPASESQITCMLITWYQHVISHISMLSACYQRAARAWMTLFRPRTFPALCLGASRPTFSRLCGAPASRAHALKTYL